MGRGSGSSKASGGGGAATAAEPPPPAAPKTITEGGVAVGKLTSEERAAVDDYSGILFQDINGRLRSTYTLSNADVAARLDARIAAIDAAIGKGTLAQEATLYRGTRTTFVGDLKPGTVISDKAFTSASRSQSVAEGFGHDAMLRIKAPKGQHAVDVTHHTGGSEKEILLPRNTKLKITKVSQAGKRIVIDVTVIR